MIEFVAWLPLMIVSAIVLLHKFWWLLVLVFGVYEGWTIWARSVTKKHARYQDGPDMTAKNQDAPGEKLRVCIIGSGISGVGAMKVALQEGMDPVCFEVDETVGGFWRYKEECEHPSVYKVCHIDTDRDLCSYPDRIWDPDNTPLLIDQDMITKYLHDNIKEFDLGKRIRFKTRVDFVTPSKDGPSKANGLTRWDVSFTNMETQESRTERFDAVFVCTGRHGGGAYVPRFVNDDTTTVEIIHSSKYKYPEKHDLVGKTVVVVGVGNSGIDIVTDVCRKAEKTYLVSRSGIWVQKPGHGENAFSEAVGETLAIEWMFRLPWFFITEIWERVGLFSNQDMQKDQAILSKHGLKPKHRLLQQHYGVMSGLHGRTLHEELENGYITVKKGIKEFTKEGVIFANETESTKVDCVIMATGFKQHCEFVDPKVVDLRWHRKGNDVPLWLGCFPISKYNGICFINFIQSLTFLASDLQPRLACRIFKGEVKPPSLEDQEAYMRRLRDTMCIQHMDRQQLRVQFGGYYNYYKQLAKWIGCYPSFGKLLKERPTAIWHAWFTTWNPLQYRLVGPGRFECAERDIERIHHSRFWGINYLTNKRRQGPYNRGLSPLAWLLCVRNLAVPFLLVLIAKLCGYCVSDDLADHYEEYLAYSKKHDPAIGVTHAIELGKDPKDVEENPIGRGISVWR